LPYLLQLLVPPGLSLPLVRPSLVPGPLLVPLPLVLSVLVVLSVPLLLVRAILPVTATVPVSAPASGPEMTGQMRADDPLDPDLVWVWCPLTESAWPATPDPPAAGAYDDLGMRAAMAVAAGAGPEDGTGTGADAVCRTWIETVENNRNTIAPAETAMTGTVLPAG
jgi:hypothetical protein